MSGSQDWLVSQSRFYNTTPYRVITRSLTLLKSVVITVYVDLNIQVMTTTTVRDVLITMIINYEKKLKEENRKSKVN